MDKRESTSANWSRIYLTLECALEATTGGKRIRLYVSSAGSPDVITHDWNLSGYLPSEAQITDLAAYVTNLVQSGSVAFCGAQSILPGIS